MPSAFSDLTKNAQWYLAQVDPAKPAEAFTWQVMAARSYLALGQAKPAAALFQQLQKQGQSAEQKAQLQLLQAHLLLAQGNANQALILLEGKPEVALDADTQKDWYRQRVVLQLDINNKFGAAKSLILLEPYLAQNELATNHQQIWSLLKSMTPSTLQALEEAANHLVQGKAQLIGAWAGELLAEELRLAQQNLSEITGEFTSDDLLGRIFSSFCIGK